jgi:aspartate aminotransferase
MALIITERMKKIKPSPTLALSAKAQDLAAQGKDVISLTVGEPDWNTLPSACEGAIESIRKGQTKYTPAGGILPLRKAIVQQFEREFGIKYEFDEVTVSAGGKFLIHGICESLIDQGDEVLIPAPYWVSYPTLVEMAGGTPKFIVCDEKTDFRLKAEQVAQAITPKTKMIIVNSPSNPTGQTYTLQEWKALGEVLKKNPQVAVLTDDIYNHLAFDGKVAPHILQACPELKNQTIIVSGASKTFSMTGWRLGWVMAPKELVATLNKFHTQTVSCATSASQYAALAALEKGDEELKASIVDLTERMKRGLGLLREVSGLKVSEPTGAFYFWIDIRNFLGKSLNGTPVKNSADFAAQLLEKQLVAVIPGNEFGLDGYLRASFAIKPERFAEAVRRLSSFVSQLQ